MDIEQRGFKGVWIPREVWKDEMLTWMEKLFLVEIDSLDNENGCFASNNYFARFFKLSPQRCSQIVKSIEKKGYITSEYYMNENKSIDKRVLRIFDRGVKFTLGGYQENAKGINTFSSNKEDKDIVPFSEIVDYLNEKAGTRYKANPTSTREHINARFEEGFTLQDFKTVIDNMTVAWKDDDKMSPYLRPQTLFCTKFESYLNRKKETTQQSKYFNPLEVLGE